MPSEIVEENCIYGEQCFNTKHWQYGIESTERYAVRIINGDIENPPYHLFLDVDTPSPYIVCEGNCKNVCGNDGCWVQSAN
jgi:hypothetical protein